MARLIRKAKTVRFSYPNFLCFGGGLAPKKVKVEQWSFDLPLFDFDFNLNLNLNLNLSTFKPLNLFTAMAFLP